MELNENYLCGETLYAHRFVILVISIHNCNFQLSIQRTTIRIKA